MSRNKDTFFPSVEDRRWNTLVASEVDSSHHLTPAHPSSQLRAADGYLGSANPHLSQNVNERLKELRSMSSPHTAGRDVQNGDVRSGAPQHSVHSVNSGRTQNPVSGQHPTPFPPPPLPGSALPFPPPSFNPSLPPPGLPPFHSPSPPVGSGHSGAMFICPPPPPLLPQQGARPVHPPGVPLSPQQGARPVHPPHNVPGVPSPADVGFAAQCTGRGVRGPFSSSSRPSPAGSDLTGAGPPHSDSSARPPSVPSSAPGRSLLLPPPPFPAQWALSGQVTPHSSLSGQVTPHSSLSGQVTPHSSLSSAHLSGGQSSLPVSGQMPASRSTGEADSGRDSRGDNRADSRGDNRSAQQEVNSWLHKRGKGKEGVVMGIRNRSGETGKSVEAESRDTPLTVGQVRSKVRSVLHALAAVQGEVQQLQEERTTADQHTWQDSVHRITQLRDAYLEAKQQLDTEQVKRLKWKLDVRRKKRERQRRHRQEEEEAQQQGQFERAQKHAAIDQWREQLRQEDLNQQQMKMMKETADKTLSKVRREIREARKMLDTVSRLQKLRAIRTDTAEKRGHTFPVAVASHFTEKTNHLCQLLSQQVQAFDKEEAALKLLLETEKEEAKEKEEEEKRQKEREVQQREMEEEQQSLFGPQAMPSVGDPLLPFVQFYLQAQGSVHALHNIRQAWDGFLVPASTPMATRVPDGWVRPEPPSSSAWASTLLSPAP